LASQGFVVLRFWNRDVLKRLDAVLREIWLVLDTPHPTSPTRGEATGNTP
jgi:very-short-patch-repair endonuclease